MTDIFMRIHLFAFIALFPFFAWANSTLTIGISQFPKTFHPSFDAMAAKSYILAMSRRPVTVYNAEWALECLVCTGLPDLEKGSARFIKTDDGKDGIALDYSLPKDAVWADGKPITVDDLIFSWEMGRHPKTGMENIELYRRITHIERHSDHDLTLHVNKRTCSYQGINDLQLLPAHIEKPIFEEAPETYRIRSFYQQAPTTKGLWFGPYVISRVDTGKSVTLSRNPNWWGHKPHFDQITIRAYENTSALTSALLSEEIDMIAGETGLPMDQALAFDKRFGDDYEILYKPGLIYEHLEPNLDNPILADLRVRRALLHAMDREQISERLFSGKQPVAHGQTNPLDRVYVDDIPRYAYDPNMARNLLEEAGWKDKGGRFRENDQGDSLKLELATTAGNKSRELVSQVLQAQFAQVGIDLSIKTQPARVFFGDTVRMRRFTGLAMFAFLSSPENIPLTSLKSDAVPTEENGWAGQNYPGYRSREMDSILDRLETDCSDDAQTKAWRDLQHLYAKDLPALPLYFRSNSYILPKGLEGLVPTGHQYPTTLAVEYWTMEP